jgi:hypothetical protein
MKKVYSIFIAQLTFILLFLLPGIKAQTEDEKLITLILHKDSLFWQAYNNCDTSKFRDFFSEDVEFYHDRGGFTQGLKMLDDNMKKNLCGNANSHLRREAIAASVKVYPLHNAGVVYGAIISGDHIFYVIETGKKEWADGQAKFSNVWLLKGGDWKMARVLSYDHRPVVYTNKRSQIKLQADALNKFTGNYEGPSSGAVTVQREHDYLVFLVNNRKLLFYPESDNVFFFTERDVTLEFTVNNDKNVSGIVVKENGNVVEKLNRSR